MSPSVLPQPAPVTPLQMHILLWQRELIRRHRKALSS
jgi:hypothetical protein